MKEHANERVLLFIHLKSYRYFDGFTATVSKINSYYSSLEVKMIDLHVHTHYSCDSDTSIQQYCEKAIQDNIKYICFTDHVDFNPSDYGYGYYDADKFFHELHAAQRSINDFKRYRVC